MIVGEELRENFKQYSQIIIEKPIVYQTAICGLWQGIFLTILPSSKNLLPYTLITDPITFDTFKKTALEGSLKVVLPACIEYQSVRVNKNPILINKETIRKQMNSFLELFHSEEKDLFSEIQTDQETFSLVSQLMNSIKKKDLSKTKNILGKGIGLTPALDDFILGLYSFLCAQGDEERKSLLEGYILLNLNKTTLVSMWALRYSVEAQLFPQVLSSFYHTYEVVDLLPLLKHGSTSGLDLITGIYFGISHFG